MSYDPKESVIEPYRFTHNGTEYAIGAWNTPISSNPMFAIVKNEQGKWLSFGGTMNELSESKVKEFGGMGKYIQHHLDNWNKVHFSVEVPDDFLKRFSDYLEASVLFKDGKLVIE